MKKDGLFDVTMEHGYDAGEVCEFVGTFLLNKVSKKYENESNIGFYRDDGLSVFKNNSGTHLEIIKKCSRKTFKDLGLKIVAPNVNI